MVGGDDPVAAHRGAVEGWLRAWGTPGLADRTKIEWSARMTRSLGRCHVERGLVRLAAALKDEPEELVAEVLCHELAHLAARARYGPDIRPHGAEWKQLMRDAGYEPKVRLAAPPSLRAAARKRKRRLYLHACLVCGLARTARRTMARWRCARCLDAGRSGTLRITRLDRG